MYKLPPMMIDIKKGTAWLVEDNVAPPGSQSRNNTSGCLTPDPEQNDQNTICTSIANSPNLDKSEFTFDQLPSTSVDRNGNPIVFLSNIQDDYRERFLELSYLVRCKPKVQNIPPISVRRTETILRTKTRDCNQSPSILVDITEDGIRIPSSVHDDYREEFIRLNRLVRGLPTVPNKPSTSVEQA